MHVPVGIELPIGSIVRVGPDPEVVRAARNVEFKLLKPLIWKHGEKAKSQPVVKNPNGWNQKTVSHDINLDFDTVVYFAGESNEVGKSLLERIDD